MPLKARWSGGMTDYCFKLHQTMSANERS